MSRFRRLKGPLCGCRMCNEYTKWCPTRRRWNKFVHGHQNRGKNNSCYGKIGKTHPHFNKENAEKKAKEPPLCKCNCGNRTKWDTNKNKYNDYLRGHYWKIFPCMK
ncbi:hypothetical protein LCGC14_2822410, partial [marine sediment metagenome]